ncbi:hypothetical protein GCM10010176_103240 [Nonomuraea spiralis]|nr:hypothetical protein GCM10010176_103240 [Nonomuraea spiralis]
MRMMVKSFGLLKSDARGGRDRKRAEEGDGPEPPPRASWFSSREVKACPTVVRHAPPTPRIYASAEEAMPACRRRPPSTRSTREGLEDGEYVDLKWILYNNASVRPVTTSRNPVLRISAAPAVPDLLPRLGGR